MKTRGRFQIRKAVAAFALLLALSFADAAPARAQVMTGDAVWRPQGTVLAATREEHGDNVGEPSVIPNDARPQVLTDRATVWKMWFGGSWASPGVFYAESPDGVRWTPRPGAVIQGRVRNRVFKVGPVYHAYCAPATGAQIDHYTSADGVNWTLAAAAVIKPGSGWEATQVHSSYVWIEGPTWYMLYDGGNGSSYSVGLATSRDGNVWTKSPSNPVIPNAGRVRVHKVGSTYYAWGQFIPPGPLLPTDIYRWSSTNRTSWSVSAVNALPRTTPDEGAGLPTGQAADTDIHEVGGRVYLYYTATPHGDSREGRAHIKLATADMSLAQLVKTREGVNAPNVNANLNANAGAQNAGAQGTAGRLYDEAGAELVGWHEVRGGNLLRGGTITVTLNGAAAFTNINYVCTVTYLSVADVTAVSPLSVTKNSPASFTIKGTGNNAVQYRCVGN